MPTAPLSRLFSIPTAVRNSQFEVKIEVPFLKEGAFVAQSIATYPTVRAIRKLGALNATQLAEVEAGVFTWLGRSK
jgi:mRNA-degrading endonuclease toxin of MazEF toxin-antitoxin module